MSWPAPTAVCALLNTALLAHDALDGVLALNYGQDQLDRVERIQGDMEKVLGFEQPNLLLYWERVYGEEE